MPLASSPIGTSTASPLACRRTSFLLTLRAVRSHLEVIIHGFLWDISRVIRTEYSASPLRETPRRGPKDGVFALGGGQMPSIPRLCPCLCEGDGVGRARGRRFLMFLPRSHGPPVLDGVVACDVQVSLASSRPRLSQRST